MRPEVERFGRFTLVHFVSPSDEPEADDALALLAYGCQFVRLQGREGKLAQGQVVLFVVCSSLTPRYLAALERLEGRLARVEPGLWQGVVAGFRLEVVETSERSATPGEALWRTVSKAFLHDPTGGVRLDEEEREVVRRLQRHVQRYEAQGDELMASELAKISRGLREVTRRIIEEAPVEDRLAGLAPEQRLAGLEPEQRLAGLTAEQRKELLALLSAPARPAKAPRPARPPARPKRRAGETGASRGSQASHASWRRSLRRANQRTGHVSSATTTSPPSRAPTPTGCQIARMVSTRRSLTSDQSVRL